MNSSIIVSFQISLESLLFNAQGGNLKYMLQHWIRRMKYSSSYVLRTCFWIETFVEIGVTLFLRFIVLTEVVLSCSPVRASNTVVGYLQMFNLDVSPQVHLPCCFEITQITRISCILVYSQKMDFEGAKIRENFFTLAAVELHPLLTNQDMLLQSARPGCFVTTRVTH